MSVYNRKSWYHNGQKHWIHNGKHYHSRIKKRKKYIDKIDRNSKEYKLIDFSIGDNFGKKGSRKRDYWVNKIASEQKTKDYLLNNDSLEEKINDTFGDWINEDNNKHKNDFNKNYLDEYSHTYKNKTDDEFLSEIYESNEDFERELALGNSEREIIDG